MTYAEFIQNIIDSRGQWNIPDGEYFEMHHIIPYSMNGDGDTKKDFLEEILTILIVYGYMLKNILLLTSYLRKKTQGIFNYKQLFVRC